MKTTSTHDIDMNFCMLLICYKINILGDMRTLQSHLAIKLLWFCVHGRTTANTKEVDNHTHARTQMLCKAEFTTKQLCS